MQVGEGDDLDIEDDLGRGDAPDEAGPVLGRDRDAHAGVGQLAGEPGGVDERAPASLADDHALAGQLGQRAVYGIAGDPELFAQLVLGRQLPVGAEPPLPDGLDQGVLQLQVERIPQGVIQLV